MNMFAALDLNKLTDKVNGTAPEEQSYNSKGKTARCIDYKADLACEYSYDPFWQGRGHNYHRYILCSRRCCRWF